MAWEEIRQKWSDLFPPQYPNDAVCYAKSQVCKYHVSLVLKLYDTIFTAVTAAHGFFLVHISYTGCDTASLLFCAQLRQQ